jgi:DNA-binding transcriptional MerR regulator
MRLKISDLARLFSLSTEALRFYEREGVIAPGRDDKNNYRSYDHKHLKIISKCALLRSLGFSLREIKDIIETGTYEGFLNMLEEKEVELAREEMRLAAKRTIIGEYRDKIRSIPALLNTFTVVESPELVCLINQHDRAFTEDEALIELTRKWLQNLPMIKLSVLVRREDVLNRQAWSRHHGYSIDLSRFDAAGLEVAGLTTRLAPRKCLYTVQSFNLSRTGKWTLIDTIADYVERNGFVINGDMFGHQIFINGEIAFKHDSDGGRAYYEYWIPIE